MHSMQVDLDQRLGELQTVTSPQEIVETARRNSKVLVDPKLLELHQLAGAADAAVAAVSHGGVAAGRARPDAGRRTLAAFHGRDYAVPDDVVELALPALRHRVILSAEAEVEGRTVDELLGELIRSVEVPRL